MAPLPTSVLSFPTTLNVLKRVACTCCLQFFFSLAVNSVIPTAALKLLLSRPSVTFVWLPSGNFSVLVLSYQQYLTVDHVFFKTGFSLASWTLLAVLPPCLSPLLRFCRFIPPVLSLKTLSLSWWPHLVSWLYVPLFPMSPNFMF